MPDLSTLLRRARGLLLAALTATLAFPAFAEDDPPGRIGRIAWTSGEVYLNNPDTGELAPDDVAMVMDILQRHLFT